MIKKENPQGLAGPNAGIETIHHNNTPHEPENNFRIDFLVGLLNGATHASAMMPWGRFGPIRLPDDPVARRQLVQAHVAGERIIVDYSPSDVSPSLTGVNPLVLAAYCPGADGLCRWLAIDLDAAKGHGDKGLVEPARAARYLAERCDSLGLLGGLVVARSRRAQGRHCWLIPPYPVCLDDAVDALSYLIALTFHCANNDCAECECSHPFGTRTGVIASPGDPGAIELIPRSNDRPPFGWSLVLPAAGAFVSLGGTVVVDPFEGKPAALTSIPRCDVEAWCSFLNEARRVIVSHAHMSKLSLVQRSGRPSRRELRKRLHPATEELLSGRVREGVRNQALFASTCNLIGSGVPFEEATLMAMEAARVIGLPEKEARATIQSASRRMRK